MIVLLSTISLDTGSSDKIMEDFGTWISCNAGGVKAECEAIREAIQEDTNDGLILSSIVYVLVALVTWVNLFFVIKVSDIKAVYKRYFHSSSGPIKT